MQLLLTLLRTHCMVAPRPFLTSNAHVLITLRGYNLSANILLGPQSSSSLGLEGVTPS